MPLALANGRVLTASGFRSDCVVLIEDARIAALCAPGDPRLRGAATVDLGGDTLLPGFIDVQVNGGGGVLFNDTPDVATIARIGAAHRRYGTTGFLPTLISDTPQVMRAAIAAVDEAIASGVPGVLGIHLEGPHLAPGRRGAHDAAHFRALDAEQLEIACSLRRGATVLTLAPECVAPAQVRALAARGVIVSLGHTEASYEQARAALDAGARGFTHLYNAMSPLAGRAPGVVGAALGDRASWCGLIADGHHVHPGSLRVALAAKPRDRLMLVTDAMPPVGADSPAFSLAGRTITCRDGRCETPEGVLAGSALDMARAVRNAVEWLDLPLEDAARMASAWPAAFLGQDDRRGRIAPGLAADLVQLDAAFGVRRSWIAGREA
jgi:N-acetylglucosamine-6-phosphate deacetylase